MEIKDRPHLEDCPCCGHEAKAVTNDWMVIVVQCQHSTCGLKVERCVVNSRTWKKALAMCAKAWNRRPAPPSLARLSSLFNP